MIHTITEPFGVAAGRLSQVERSSAGLSAAPPPGALAGPIPTVWYSDGIRGGWDLSAELITESQPPAVQLHTWEPDRAVAKVRAAVPGVQIIVGVGVDGVARHVAKGDWSHEKGVRTLVALAQRAHEVGARAICWNAEAAWKAPPNSVQAGRIDQLVRETLARVEEAWVDLAQWHTAYDHPTYHSTYPWAAWLMQGSPIVRSLPQVYAAPEGGVAAHVGALPRREATALESWATAIRKGWVGVDDPATVPREGVIWSPYYQIHHVTAVDTVAGAMRHDLCALWALPTRADAAGRQAFQMLCSIWHAGLWGDVRALQRRVGVADDGVYGPATHAAVVRVFAS